jgi:DNA repair exonuclease SbcCD ATPase subunit
MTKLATIDRPAALPSSRAEQVEKIFVPMLEKAKELEARFNEVVKLGETPEGAQAARSLRLEYRKTRVEVEKRRKEEGKAYLEAKRFVDAIAKIYTATAGDKEDRLKDLEEYEKRREEERRAQVQAEREKALLAFMDPEELPENLGGLSDDIWTAYFEGAKRKFEEMKEAERKAEEERKKREEEERKERERLQKQAEEERKKREALEAKMKAEEDKRRKEEEERRKAEAARLEKERKEREALEAKQRKAEEEARKLREAEEARRREEEERKRKEAEEEAARLEAEKAKGDKEKAQDFAAKIQALIDAAPAFKSKAYCLKGGEAVLKLQQAKESL